MEKDKVNQEKEPGGLSRRQFINTAAAVTAGFAAVGPRPAAGRSSAS
jgi:hypothetical protein